MVIGLKGLSVVPLGCLLESFSLPFLSTSFGTGWNLTSMTRTLHARCCLSVMAYSSTYHVLE